MKSRVIIGGLIALLLAGCGSAAISAVSVTPVPTVTPLSASQPTATPQPTSADGEQREQRIAAAKAAMDSTDYLLVIDQLWPVYQADPNDQGLALMLAQAYHAQGTKLLADKKRNADMLRSAFDTFNAGLEVVPVSDTLHTTLETDQQATKAALEAQLALDSYAEAADFAAQQQQAEAAYAVLQRLIELQPDFPQLNTLQGPILVNLSQVRQLAASDTSGDERKQLLLEAKDLCAQASALWPVDAEEAAPAHDCLERIAARLNPPKPTAVPAQKPAAPPPADPRLSFAGYIQTGYPGGANSGQFSACINGRVLHADGSPVAAASGNVNNGASALNWTTNSDGYFSACGLGYSNWGVVLYFVPGPGLRSEAVVNGVWLDGSPGQQAFVVFQAR